MTIQVKVDDDWKDIAAIHHKVGGSWKVVSDIWINRAGAWQQVYPINGAPGAANLTVTIPSGNVSGSRSGTGAASTNPATAVPAGGTAPYTYAWSKVSGHANLAVTSPAAATTVFNTSSIAPGQTQSAVFKVVVTDTNGDTAEAQITATLTAVTVPLPPPAPPSSLDVSLSPSTVNGSRSGAGIATTGPMSAIVSGGSGSYSYSWSAYQGASPNNPNSPSTTFSKNLADGENATSDVGVIVTDSSGLQGSAATQVSFNSTATPVGPPAGPLSLNCSPSSVSGTGPDVGAFTSPTYANATGGTPPYSYSAVRTGGVHMDIYQSGNQFTFGAIYSGDYSVDAFFQITVTDSLGATSTFGVAAHIDMHPSGGIG